MSLTFGKSSYKLLKFIGRKSFFWINLSILSGLSLAVIEVLLSIIIAMVLRSLGITDSNLNLPPILSSKVDHASWLLFGLIIIGFSRGFFQFLVVQSAKVAQEMILLRLKLILNYQYFHSEFAHKSTTDYTFKHNEVFPNAALLSSYVTAVFPYFLQAGFLFIFLLYRSISSTLVGFAMVVVIGFIVHFTNKKSHQIIEELNKKSNEYFQKSITTIKNWFLLKVTKTLDTEYNKLIKNALSYAASNVRINFLVNASGAIPSALGTSIVAVLILLQLKYPEHNGLAFIGYLYIFIRFVQNLGFIAHNYGFIQSQFHNFKSAASFFFAFDKATISEALKYANHISLTGTNWKKIDKYVEKTSDDELVFTKRENPKPPTIKFNNVSFQYPKTNQPILTNLSFEVRSGESIAIAGKSGKGKSTILSILTGILVPNSGEVKVNDLSPIEYFQNIKVRIGYVGPESYLIHGSIRDNLIYGNPYQVSDDDIRESLELAQLRSSVEALPKGIDHRITESGEGLSTGQKQRLCLARAFLLKPDILILDEPTANLDLDTEREIAFSLQKLIGKSTIIVVSHSEGLIQFIQNKLVL